MPENISRFDSYTLRKPEEDHVNPVTYHNLLRQASQKLDSQHRKNSRDWTFLEVRTPAELKRCDALIIPGGESTTMSLVAARSGLLDPLRDYVKQQHHLMWKVRVGRIRKRPVWGTCAGLILLAESANRTKKGGQELIGGIDVRVNRNHFGRQVESFEADLDLPYLTVGAVNDKPFRGVFIRAPIVEEILSAVRDVQHEERLEEHQVNAPSRKSDGRMPSESAREEVRVLGTVPKRANEPPNGIIPGRPKTLKEDIVAVKQGNVFGTSFHPELTGDPRIHIWWLEQVLNVVEQAEKNNENATAATNDSAS
ncbi:MAG: hypothetical protein M1816_002669 [Peltula sp. TS41687]|nr:MAG: hypothetical protein M1816_002669 [Peltula sp. TS41687]